MDAEVDDDAVETVSWRDDVASRLRAARQRQGLEIEDIAERLKLRTSFVAAVEDGRGNEHMDEPYEWSHIKTIARLLGIELEAR